MNHVRVGVGVIIRRDGRVLLGLRQGAHGSNTWSLPGGHLEYGETPEQTAEREVLEETGLVIANARAVTFTNDIFEVEEKHYITLFVVADYMSGEGEIREPEKCQRWEWCTWNDLPQPQFLSLQHLLKVGYNPFA